MIKSLGPRLVRGRARVARFTVLAGTLLATLSLALVPASAQEGPRPKSVTVQAGDTLSDIAVRFYGSADAVTRIASANKIADPNLVPAGTTLTLPPGDGSTGHGGAGTQTVTVQPGESLSALSVRLYGTPVYAASLAEINKLSNPDLVVTGTKINAPLTPPSAGTAPAPAGRVTPGGRTLAGKKICLDPGHGGVIEPGAVFDFGDGKILREADVTLDIARTLTAWLQADGAIVNMTRERDIFMELETRAALCNIAGADIAVSVHLNGIDNPSWNGALTLFFKAIDRRLAENIYTAMQTGLAKSAPGGNFTAFGAQPFTGSVLMNTLMPAVIVEPVFLTHPAEARALLRPITEADSRRNQIVLEIYRGIRLYFAQ